MTFDQFWRLYPRKVARKPAKQVWDKLSAEDQAKALLGVRNYAKSCVGKEKQFILHAKTYLNQERWDDELELPEKSPAEKWLETLYDDRSGSGDDFRRDAENLRSADNREEMAGRRIAGRQINMAETTGDFFADNAYGSIAGDD